MGKHVNLFLAATEAILRTPARSGVVLFCLLAVLLPFVTAMAVAEGVRQESLVSVQAGADLYVARDQYGRNGPVSLDRIPELEKIPGVVRVVPRIVGRAYLGEDLAVIVGIDEPGLLGGVQEPLGFGQALMGEELARRLDLRVGSEFRFFLFPALPFTLAGLIDPALSIWSSRMVVIPFQAAEQLFKLPGKASELLVYCRPGTADQVAEQLGSLGKPWEMTPPLRIQTKAIVHRYIKRGFDIQAGTFTMFYATAFALAIPALLILSGFGQGERRRRIGIMKATGWQTLDILEMTVYENLLLALTGSTLTLALAVCWLRVGNGIGIAPLFISQAGWVPSFAVPVSFTPLPVVFSFLFGLVLTMLGTIVPTWKTAVTPPLTTMG